MGTRKENREVSKVASGEDGHQGDRVRIPRTVRGAVDRFLRAHGGSADAVIEPVGRVGVRIALVGKDGVLGDQVVADHALARAVIGEFSDLESAEWDRALTSAVTLMPGHHRKMAGWLTGCARSVHHRICCRVTRRITLAEVN